MELGLAPAAAAPELGAVIGLVKFEMTKVFGAED